MTSKIGTGGGSLAFGLRGFEDQDFPSNGKGKPMQVIQPLQRVIRVIEV